jgi:16S rRNA C1402 (ribose-2'-O) methylase RsmI
MLEDILQALHPETYLCIATDITLPTEYIKTKRASAWKENIDSQQTLHFYHPKCSFVALLIILYILSKIKKMKIKKETFSYLY